ncbi:MAG: phosphate acetyltransferase [Alphaproteobacteria bacterium]|nr:phosphate acetyltransferase [Alphaproteobacteria bacterium]
MPRTLLVAPAGPRVGLTTVCLGLLRALERQGLRAAFCKPIGQPGRDDDPVDASGQPMEHTTALVAAATGLLPPTPVSADDAEQLLSADQLDTLMEQVVQRHDRAGRMAEADVVVVEGLWAAEQAMYAQAVNEALARTVDADVLLVASARGTDGVLRAPDDVAEEAAIAARAYGGAAGVVLNMLEGEEPEGAHVAPLPAALSGAGARVDEERLAPWRQALAMRGLSLLGAIPVRAALMAPRVSDLARALDAEVLFPGELDRRRVREVAVCARTVPGVLDAYRPGALIITPPDRHDVLMSASLASLAGTRLAGILLTHHEAPDPRVLALCKRAFDQGLPLLHRRGSSFDVARSVGALDMRVPVDDLGRVEAAMNHVASHIDARWLSELVEAPRAVRLSPAAFRHQLIERARARSARIVLPEGEEPRTITAAALCQARGIARCVLLGDPARIRAVASDRGVSLPPDLEIIAPADVADAYVAPMVALRRHKGLTESAARDQLRDTVVLGTMMLQRGEVDGLVSGAVHTTANTIRPALQLIRTQPGQHLVSSCFFMLLPDNVLVFADCAVNPDPTAEELAEIAVATAETAAAFGVLPRVAMISYATGQSAEGVEVAKVARATELARALRPDLCLDGPMQYDAAVVPAVAAKKAPGSPVAGQATVFVFPDLNTGNTTYKAVQRSAGVVSIGPVLQGLARPVNDLSRGSLVEDIVFTIALTGIQADASSSAAGRAEG